MFHFFYGGLNIFLYISNSRQMGRKLYAFLILETHKCFLNRKSPIGNEMIVGACKINKEIEIVKIVN